MDTKILLFISTNKPSEWYLPDSNKYKEFIEFVLDFISVQTPVPEEGYHFFVANKKIRENLKQSFSSKALEKRCYNIRDIESERRGVN